MTHIMQPVRNKRTFQRCIVIFIAFQTLFQVFTGIAYPSWHIDKSHNFTVQALFTCQTVQRFQIHVYTLILEFITTACSHNQRIIAQMSTQQLISQIQQQSTGIFSFLLKLFSFGNEIIFKAIHQDHVRLFVQQFLTFIVGNIADCSKTIYMMGCLLFNRMF